MNSDILFFFGEHMDALPLYERLEDQILTQIPEVKIKVAKPRLPLLTNEDSLLCPLIPAARQRIGQKSG